MQKQDIDRSSLTFREAGQPGSHFHSESPDPLTLIQTFEILAGHESTPCKICREPIFDEEEWCYRENMPTKSSPKGLNHSAELVDVH